MGVLTSASEGVEPTIREPQTKGVGGRGGVEGVEPTIREPLAVQMASDRSKCAASALISQQQVLISQQQMH